MPIFIKSNHENQVVYRHNMPFHEKHGLGKTQAELEQEGLLVDYVPTPDTSDKTKMAVLYINPETKELYYQYEDIPDTPESEVALLRKENATLQSAVSELTMFVASQDEKIEQQNQAISELSILIAGGM
ncbi:phage protein [Bacillus sp. OxB-1]|uniref:hypothetical protein n=1 Tax=Bacillus sp. (strain OxB-1) TaxID=98228 RepID=UPI0005822C2D|nr:hypothetical protein [Bacillus sp. OxB-1]BAQ11289.1 hypothetical protein OXB_2818 [Bacillus sp. OxB-1]BAQ11432.1 phage protein [Bacillus sp. OxB-1]